jgi:hypothetical protein
MAWDVRLYVVRLDPGLERLWAANGIRVSGFGLDTPDGRGPWYRLRYDQRAAAEHLQRQYYATRPPAPRRRRWWHFWRW